MRAWARAGGESGERAGRYHGPAGNPAARSGDRTRGGSSLDSFPVLFWARSAPRLHPQRWHTGARPHECLFRLSAGGQCEAVGPGRGVDLSAGGDCMSESIFETASADETRALGARIAALLEPGDVVLLHGDLGAGKTTLTQGIGAALGMPQQAQSPIFSLVVDTPLPDGVIVRHIDLYRLDDPT